MRMTGDSTDRICRASGSSSTKAPVTKLVSGPSAHHDTARAALSDLVDAPLCQEELSPKPGAASPV